MIYHMRARYYDAASARFVSREPVWPEISDPQMLNPYQYAFNNPTGFVDVSGETPTHIEAAEVIAMLIANDDEQRRETLKKRIAQILKMLPQMTGTHALQWRVILRRVTRNMERGTPFAPIGVTRAEMNVLIRQTVNRVFTPRTIINASYRYGYSTSQGLGRRKAPASRQ